MRIKDRLLLSAWAGSMAAIAANLFLYAVNALLTGPTINMPELTAEFFLNFDPESPSALIRAMGFLWSLTVGGAYAVVTVIALEVTGWQHVMVKSVVTVSGLWALVSGPMMRLLDVGAYVRNAPVAILVFFAAHIVFAICLSMLLLVVRDRE